jgi:hypothetical protein
VLQIATFQDFGQSSGSAACRHAPMPAAG